MELSNSVTRILCDDESISIANSSLVHCFYSNRMFREEFPLNAYVSRGIPSIVLPSLKVDGTKLLDDILETDNVITALLMKKAADDGERYTHRYLSDDEKERVVSEVLGFSSLDKHVIVVDGKKHTYTPSTTTLGENLDEDCLRTACRLLGLQNITVEGDKIHGMPYKYFTVSTINTIIHHAKRLERSRSLQNDNLT